MVVIVSQHHLTGRPCWSWLAWFICLSTRLWCGHPTSGVRTAPRRQASAEQAEAPARGASAQPSYEAGCGRTRCSVASSTTGISRRASRALHCSANAVSAAASSVTVGRRRARTCGCRVSHAARAERCGRPRWAISGYSLSPPSRTPLPRPPPDPPCERLAGLTLRRCTNHSLPGACLPRGGWGNPDSGSPVRRDALHARRREGGVLGCTPYPGFRGFLRWCDAPDLRRVRGSRRVARVEDVW